MENNVNDFDKCANCGACINICPTEAIKMNATGMYYEMSVETDLCIGCGKCKQVCPINNKNNEQHLISAYAGYSKDSNVRKNSSSGGIFHELAKFIIEQGGVVFGAVYSADCRQVIFGNSDEYSLDDIRRSKYVESLVGDSFKKIKYFLGQGRKVLFCGTPCQAAGLVKYLGKKDDNLIVCDFSCGGVPSHKMYEEYLDYLQKKFCSTVNKVNFRPKNFGWENHSILIEFKNNKKYTRICKLDPYYKAFLGLLSKRDYCYSCDFSDNHYSDIILADFWLYSQLSDYENDHLGLSLVITNSIKGEKLINAISKSTVLKKVNIEEASYNMYKTILDEKQFTCHKKFVAYTNKYGFTKAVKRFLPDSLAFRFKQIVKSFLTKRRTDDSEKIRS